MEPMSGEAHSRSRTEPGPGSGFGGWCSKVLFLVVILPAVLRARLRSGYWLRHGSLDRAIEELRTVRPFRWRFLHNPRWLAGAVNRLQPWLPRRGTGPCLLRSLMLLDLWARCELEPRLHLALRRTAEGAAAAAEGHAWVTSSVDRELGTSDQGYRETFSL